MNKNEKIKKEVQNGLDKKIKRLAIKNGKVVYFKRDYDNKNKEWNDSGKFYLYEVRNSKVKKSSKQLLVPFVWNENDSERSNLRKARGLANDYTRAFNVSDREARNMLQNDLYYLADWGMTFTDALSEAKGIKTIDN